MGTKKTSSLQNLEWPSLSGCYLIQYVRVFVNILYEYLYLAQRPNILYTHALASGPTVTIFMQRFRLFLGQCAVGYLNAAVRKEMQQKNE